MPISIRSSPSSKQLKLSLARFCDAVGLNHLCFGLLKLVSGDHIRAINYHNIDPSAKENLESHLAYYSRRFVSVGIHDLSAFLSTGSWPHDKPGLIISFDDGHISTFEIAVPILERFGFKGWFFVPPSDMRIDIPDGRRYGKEPSPVGLDPEMLQYLAEHHIVGSHTETHLRLGPEVETDRLEYEIVGSKAHLEGVTGNRVDSFAWVGGDEGSYSRTAAEVIRRTYKFGFMTNSAVIRKNNDPFQLQRTNIEAGDPLSLVRFQLSGLMDAFYWPKRRRVNRLTAP